MGESVYTAGASEGAVSAEWRRKFRLPTKSGGNPGVVYVMGQKTNVLSECGKMGEAAVGEGKVSTVAAFFLSVNGLIGSDGVQRCERGFASARLRRTCIALSASLEGTKMWSW